MQVQRFQPLKLALAVSLVAGASAAPSAFAQGADNIEEVVVLGSRRVDRSATDAAVPVDVFTGDEFVNQGLQDMDDLLRNTVPSYNVQRAPISDAATITRPATMRGLPPDNVLILVNGKRRHRAAVIAELGGSLAAGSQGPDLSVIPALAIQQVEVLRDGAAAIYGSDAIAGVINFGLKEDASGITAMAQYGEMGDGDGEAYLVGLNAGFPLGPNGFANLTFQVKESDPTSRSTQRTDAQGLIDAGYPVREPYAQIWGSPEIRDDYAFFLNSGIDLSDNQRIYAFGNYAERTVEGGFFFRNPNSRGGVFTQGSNRAIMDTDLAGVVTGRNVSNCPVLPSPGSGNSALDPATVAADAAAQAALPANCFLFNSAIPGGFTPQFGASVEDISLSAGIKGELDMGLLYDVSIGLGQNEASFFLNNTLNPSLGPDSPRDFNLGTYKQTEQRYNADFVYPIAVDGLASDLNVAFGAEYRVETFTIGLGAQESWDAGDYAFQTGQVDDPTTAGVVEGNFYADGTTPLPAMSIGANGFAGFGPTQIGEFDRGNYAVYLDLEADVVEGFTLGGAVRFEDFEDFGTTTNFKLVGRWQITPEVFLRGSASTGFRAPTPGQSNVTKVSTITVDGVLQQRGQIPPTNQIAGFLGAEPLDAEESVNFTLGGGWDITDELNVTVDYFWINVDDRISQTGTINIAGEPIPSGANCPTTLGNGGTLSQCLQELGVPGAADLSSVSFFTNDFETETQGIDVVATWSHAWEAYGNTNFTAAWNWTETSVERVGTEVARNRVLELENFNPQHRGIFTLNHTYGDFGVLVRASYYDDWIDGDWTGDPTFTAGNTAYTVDCTRPLQRDNCYDGSVIWDVEFSYTFQERYSFALGGQNVGDDNGPLDIDNIDDGNVGSGNTYTTSSPWGFDGAFWYGRVRVDLD